MAYRLHRLRIAVHAHHGEQRLKRNVDDVVIVQAAAQAVEDGSARCLGQDAHQQARIDEGLAKSVHVVEEGLQGGLARGIAK